VLEHQGRVNEIEGVVGEAAEIAHRVVVVAAAVPVAVVAPRQLDHRGGDVDAVHGFETLGQRLREPARPAPEIKGSTAGDSPAVLLDRPEDDGDFLDAVGEEILHGPAALVLAFPGDRCPVRIGAPKAVPDVFQRS
jgi:hypothetical protein